MSTSIEQFSRHASLLPGYVFYADAFEEPHGMWTVEAYFDAPGEDAPFYLCGYCRRFRTRDDALTWGFFAALRAAERSVNLP